MSYGVMVRRYVDMRLPRLHKVVVPRRIVERPNRQQQEVIRPCDHPQEIVAEPWRVVKRPNHQCQEVPWFHHQQHEVVPQRVIVHLDR